MARAKKEAPKPSPEQRMKEIWDQQVFFIVKSFPDAEKKVNDLRKQHEKKQKVAKGKTFQPTETAVSELKTLYMDLKSRRPAPTIN